MTALGPQTSPEVAEAGSATLLVPLGSTEQHGPHLPLNTDAVIAHHWCIGMAAASIPASVVVAPVLPYGSSGEHQQFAGTLSIGADALHLVLVELARSAAGSFRRVVFVSGHAGNLRPLLTARDQLRHEGHDVRIVVPVIEGSDAHAGFTETSLMLHLAPELVHMDRAESGCVEPIADLMSAMEAAGVIAVSSNGILGDPRAASAEAGFGIFNELVAHGMASLDV